MLFIVADLTTLRLYLQRARIAERTFVMHCPF